MFPLVHKMEPCSMPAAVGWMLQSRLDRHTAWMCNLLVWNKTVLGNRIVCLFQIFVNESYFTLEITFHEVQNSCVTRRPFNILGLEPKGRKLMFH